VTVGPAQRKLYGKALGQHGIVTTEDARGLGIDGAVLRMLHSRGRVARLSRGVYRFPEMPAGPLDQYAAATFWPEGVRGILSHATALERHDLCDVNPTRIDLTLPRTYDLNPRRVVPPHLNLHFEDVPHEDLASLEGLPIVTPVRAIVEAIGGALRADLVEQAIDTLKERGVLSRAEARRITAARAQHGAT
jgi:predicted transcriptional regulator of viral defense system